MRKWNAPEIQALDLNKTESGFFNFDWESPFNIISHKKPVRPDSVPTPAPTPAPAPAPTPDAPTDLNS